MLGSHSRAGLTKETKAIVYLFDTAFSLNPLNYVSNLFLSAAVYNRFLVPQVYLLSESDMLSEEDVNKVVDWSASPPALEHAIEQKLTGTKRLLSRNMMRGFISLV